jgi:hypothetical protein
MRVVRSRGERIANYCSLKEKRKSTVQPSVGGHSCNSLNIPAEIEDLKSGQLVNGEAIKALVESVPYITGVISWLQDCGGKSGNRFS